MEALLQEFISLVDKQNQVLDQMVEMGETKQRLVIAGKVKELDSLIQREGVQISALEKLEAARFKLQQDIGRSWAVEEPLTASAMLERIRLDNPAINGEMERSLNRLIYNLTRLKAINTHNNELIEQSLQYIETMQAMLNGDIAGTYSDKGHPVDEKSGRQINLLDTRA